MAIVVFILVLGVLVLVHEWGHFFAARKFGIRVDEFGFGIPPRLWGKKIGATLYSLNLLPIGGFVKIYGESGAGAGERESFATHPVWHRVIIILAGVFMNLVLAWALFSLGHIIGIPAVAGEGVAAGTTHVTIIAVAPGSPAANAKLAFGDIVSRISAGGDSITPQTASELIGFVSAHRGGLIQLAIRHDVSSDVPAKIIEIQSRANPPAGEGPLGVALQDIGILRSPWYLAPWRGLESVWLSIQRTIEAFASVFQSIAANRAVPDGISGPLGLYVLTGEVQRLGVSYFLQFVALLSVNLAILNAVPFPALDGGRVLFLIIEKIRGRPVLISYEQAAHAIGFVLLLILILIISYRDLHRFFL